MRAAMVGRDGRGRCLREKGADADDVLVAVETVIGQARSC
jgi:hypothetical protein